VSWATEHGGDSLGTIQCRSSHDELSDCEHGGDFLGSVEGRSSHDELSD
jgi:hypothetical protein